MYDPDRHDDVFHVVPYDYLPGDGPSCHFLVTRFRDGMVRHIVVTVDRQGFYEFIVDGGEQFFDTASEPDYLTIPLMISTSERLAQVYETQRLVDGLLASGAMDPGQVH